MAGQSIAAWLSSQVVSYTRSDWRSCVISGISDVDDAEKYLFIIPGDMDMTLVEREIAARGALGRARQACRWLLDEASQAVDFVLVDCAPGISTVTECWLRECDWHLIPIKPDILAVSGMEYLRLFRQRNPGLGFASHLGVLVNMKDMRSPTDQMTHEFLSKDESLRCFRVRDPADPAYPESRAVHEGQALLPEQVSRRCGPGASRRHGGNNQARFGAAGACASRPGGAIARCARG